MRMSRRSSTTRRQSAQAITPQPRTTLATPTFTGTAETREENLDRALSAYTAALSIRTREADPYGWARTQNNIGNAYSHRIHGEQTENQRLAIAAYESALQVHDAVTYPEDFAMAKSNLARVYREYGAGSRTQNLDRAMECLLCAMLVTPPPTQFYARVALSLAEAFSLRLQLTPESLRGEVSAALRSVVEALAHAELVYGIPTAEHGHRTRTPAGISASALPDASDAAAWMPDADLFRELHRTRYLTMPLPALIDELYGPEAQASLSLRVELLQASLARPDIVLPPFRARLLDMLGESFLLLDTGDVAQNREEALKLFHEALEALTPEQHPDQWALVQHHLASAYGQRNYGDRAENLERAIQHGHVGEATLDAHANPTLWAQATALLGQLYRDRRVGDRQENCKRAIALFETVASEIQGRDPYMWARMQNSIGV